MEVTRRSGVDPGTALRWTATTAWLLAVGAILATLAFYVLRGASSQPTGFVQGPLGVSAIAMTGLLYSSVGAFLLRRQPRDPIAWALLGIGIGMAVILPLDRFVESSIHGFRLVPAGTLVTAWALTAVHMPASGAAVVLVTLLFPTGHIDWRYGRQTLALAVVGTMLLAIGSALRPEGLLWYPTLPNPLSVPVSFAPVVGLLSLVGVGAFVGSLALAAGCLVWRYQSGTARQRRLLAWVAVGATAMAGSVALFYIGRYAGTVAGSQGERLAFIAAVGAALLPLAMLRFATVTASQGQETRDLTFLFTDLQDSTAMYASIGDVFAFDLVRLHFDTLTAVARRRRGAIVKTIGDALMARFLDPADAVQAALEMFERLDNFNRTNATKLVLKVGIHRGDAIVVSGRHGTDYFGQTVNIASRIGAIATPGEIVLSDVVRQGSSVPTLLAGYQVREEQASLKGVSGEVLVHRLRPTQAVHEHADSPVDGPTLA
jgi:class 3 adenylate cyclase